MRHTKSNYNSPVYQTDKAYQPSGADKTLAWAAKRLYICTWLRCDSRLRRTSVRIMLMGATINIEQALNPYRQASHSMTINSDKDMNSQIINRIAALRDAMKAAKINAVIIPQTDPHQGEYLADHWQVRRFLSGFTGSAGSLVVTGDAALLWTDSRYFLQATSQLEGTAIQLMKEGVPGTPAISEYLLEHLKSGDTVGIDGMVFSAAETDALAAQLNRRDIRLDSSFDPIDTIWTDRPALPDAPVFVHDIKYAGETAKNKIAKALANANAQDADAVLISALDEIAWTLNIRSRDVKCNPVATSFLYLSPKGSTLFIDPAKLTDEVIGYLKDNGVETRPYNSVIEFLAAINGERVLIEPARNAVRLRDTLGGNGVAGTSAVALLKACKNETQIAGIRNAMVRDGVALVRAFMEIEDTVRRGDKLTEMGVADILTKYRSRQDMYFDMSFDTIAGYGPHGAIVHYSASPDTDSAIHADGLLLIDSGAQYLDGTTDITRTIALGIPTEQERHDFTLVMKGHIALGSAVYPEGTRGGQLDALARQYLWQEGLSYLHGTGHGVGQFLNVHEGPQSIRLNDVPTPLMPGMITSNEPGLYRENIHGIRCENLVLTTEAMTTEFGRFYRFETLTLFPFDRNLFDLTMMTDGELRWLNDYHAQVYARLAPELNEAERAWLKERTAPLTR